MRVGFWLVVDGDEERGGWWSVVVAKGVADGPGGTKGGPTPIIALRQAVRDLVADLHWYATSHTEKAQIWREQTPDWKARAAELRAMAYRLLRTLRPDNPPPHRWLLSVDRGETWASVVREGDVGWGIEDPDSCRGEYHGFEDERIMYLTTEPDANAPRVTPVAGRWALVAYSPAGPWCSAECQAVDWGPLGLTWEMYFDLNDYRDGVIGQDIETPMAVAYPAFVTPPEGGRDDG